MYCALFQATSCGHRNLLQLGVCVVLEYAVKVLDLRSWGIFSGVAPQDHNFDQPWGQDLSLAATHLAVDPLIGPFSQTSHIFP